MKAYCSCCQYVWEMDDCNKGKKVICPSCKRTIIARSCFMQILFMINWLIVGLLVVWLAGICLAALFDESDKSDEWNGKSGNEIYQAGEVYYGKKDFTRAVEVFCVAADRGSADAQYALGLCYQQGNGVIKNSQKAFEWYCKAAEKNHADAQHKVGRCYEKGDGVSVSEEKALEWYAKAAGLGSAEAREAQARIIKSWSDSCKVLQYTAKQGNIDAQYELAQCYYNGSKGLPKDIRIALEWFDKAAAGGHRKAGQESRQIRAELQAQYNQNQKRLQALEDLRGY